MIFTKTHFVVTFLTYLLFVSCNQKGADSLEPVKVEVVTYCFKR